MEDTKVEAKEENRRFKFAEKGLLEILNKNALTQKEIETLIEIMKEVEFSKLPPEMFEVFPRVKRYEIIKNLESLLEKRESGIDLNNSLDDFRKEFFFIDRKIIQTIEELYLKESINIDEFIDFISMISIPNFTNYLERLEIISLFENSYLSDLTDEK